MLCAAVRTEKGFSMKKRNARARYVRAVEVSALLSAAGRRKFYYDAATGKISGVRKNPSGYGYVVPRPAFESWLREHPESKVEPQPAEQVSPEVAAQST